MCDNNNAVVTLKGRHSKHAVKGLLSTQSKCAKLDDIYVHSLQPITFAATHWTHAAAVGLPYQQLGTCFYRPTQRRKCMTMLHEQHLVLHCVKGRFVPPQINLPLTLMVQWSEHWTCHQQVVGSNPTRGKRSVTTLGKLFTPMCLCHQAV